jgi:CSLREA domain-containing protein
LFQLTLAGTPSLAAFQGEALAPVQPSTDFVVNYPADPGNPVCTASGCSLRAAITAANANSLVGHTISFSMTYPVTITLSSPLPVISSTLVINGPGANNLVVSGNGQFLVLEIGDGADLTLNGLAIRQGSSFLKGAGLLNGNDTLTISDSLIANNLNGGGDGGGPYNDGGVVNILNTTFSENGAFHHGGISNSGLMTITNSTFTDNSARIGGAISNDGVLTVRNSTFSRNIATQIGGGAIDNLDTLVVVNSTFFHNGSTFGADIFNGGTLQVTNGTFYSATLPSLDSIHTGISQTITVSNTILAAGNGIENCGGDGVLNFGADNLATDATCGGAIIVTFDQLKLGTPQNNSGNTLTIALLFGSFAIDAGDDAICAALTGSPTYGAGGEDQRGVLRPQGVHCDVGAFEQALLFHFFMPIIIRPPSSP